MNKNKLVPVFLHIPKTAGSSIRIIIRKTHGKELYWSGIDFSTKDVRELPIDKISFLGGHKLLSFYEPLQQNFVFIAVVREPISRAVSFLNYAIRGPDKDMVKRYADLGINLKNTHKAILSNKQIKNEIANTQCRYLCSRDFLNASFANVLSTFHKYQFIVAAHDHIDLLLDYLVTRFSLDFDKEPFDNVGKQGYSDDFYKNKELVDTLRDVNKEDEALYQFVKRRKLYISDLV